LYDRHNAWHALHTAFLLESTQDFIANEADLRPGGREQLRRVALCELESDDERTVASSLVCLSVVGQPVDLPALDRLIAHPSELIQRAARACRFELQARKRARGGDIPLRSEGEQHGEH
jgi:hypothetical protein